jgi:hypothetical protein
MCCQHSHFRMRLKRMRCVVLHPIELMSLDMNERAGRRNGGPVKTIAWRPFHSDLCCSLQLQAERQW